MKKTIPLVGAASDEKARLLYCPPARVAPTHEEERRNAFHQHHLPIVLAGPIVRKSTAEGVWIWLATSIAIEVDAWLDVADINGNEPGPPPDPRYATGSASSLKLGH